MFKQNLQNRLCEVPVFDFMKFLSEYPLYKVSVEWQSLLSGEYQYFSEFNVKVRQHTHTERGVELKMLRTDHKASWQRQLHILCSSRIDPMLICQGGE